MNTTFITLGAHISPLFEEWGNAALPVREEIINELPWLTVSKGNLEFIFDESCILTLNLDELVQYLSEKKVDFSLHPGLIYPGRFVTKVRYCKYGICYCFVFGGNKKYWYARLSCIDPELWLTFNGKILRNTLTVDPLFNDEELGVLSKAMTGSRTGP